MTILDYTDTNQEKDLEDLREKEIYKLIPDDRLLRVLLESKIFQLREIQKEAIQKGLFFRKSFLISAPSGSGKTLIGEICAMHNIFQEFGKSIYLVPYKALATEKYFHFKKLYSRFKINIELSIGDYDVDDSKLEDADIIVTTYEKMDSLIRNFYDKEWIFDIATIIIDEIHFIGENSRGPRLESLIVRLNEILNSPQIIGLSATINNPDFFNSWLNSLGNKTILIKSEKRPVPLHFQLEISQNKNSTMKKYAKKILKKKGQVLIFVRTRKATQKNANVLQSITEQFLEEKERKICKKIAKTIREIKGGNKALQKIVEKGIAFHHAGLLPKERKLIEDNYRKRNIKIICCTTTLAAGVNVPARVVILKDFKRYVTSGYNISNFKGFYENGDGFSYFLPFSSNEVFQMLGRAGRPGLDSVGYGIILVNNLEEKMWIEDHYFTPDFSNNKLLAKYENLTSSLNDINTLKEQVLLRVYEEKKISLADIKHFFKKTYFWYIIEHKMEHPIPIEQLLLIEEISPLNILKLHSNPSKVREIKKQRNQIKITKLTGETISGYIKSQYGVFYCEFHIDKGIRCSCGFKNGISDNFVDNKFAFEFCDHITAFLIYLLELTDERVRKYVNNIIPKCIKGQYILNYLFEKGLIIQNSDSTVKCSQFGKLVIRLYLYPVSGVLIRSKLENRLIESYQDLIHEAYDVLISERRVRNRKMLDPVIEWADEVPLDDILERHTIMAGDLMSIKQNIERIITFIGIIAEHLSSSGRDIQNDMESIAEMCETLQIRIHYGIKEELFDLVLRLKNVARVRSRILFNAGYHTSEQVARETSYNLHRKTGLGVKLCKSIIDSIQKIS
jgi:replicative superfamily II helicase